jgi:hypothetical protein
MWNHDASADRSSCDRVPLECVSCSSEGEQSTFGGHPVRDFVATQSTKCMSMTSIILIESLPSTYKAFAEQSVRIDVIVPIAKNGNRRFVPIFS